MFSPGEYRKSSASDLPLPRDSLVIDSLPELYEQDFPDLPCKEGKSKEKRTTKSIKQVARPILMRQSDPGPTQHLSGVLSPISRRLKIEEMFSQLKSSRSSSSESRVISDIVSGDLTVGNIRRLKRLLKTDEGDKSIIAFAEMRMVSESYHFLKDVCRYRLQLDRYLKLTEGTGYVINRTQKQEDYHKKVLELHANLLEEYIQGNPPVGEKDKEITKINISERAVKSLSPFQSNNEAKLNGDMRSNKDKHQKLVNQFDQAESEVCEMDWVSDYFKSENFALLVKKYRK